MIRLTRVLRTPLLSLLLASFAWGQEPAGDAGAFDRGRDLYKRRQFQAALQEFSKVTEAQPNRAEAHYLKGYCHYMLKQYGEAVDAFGKAFTADPKLDPRTIFARAPAPPPATSSSSV
jgi:tetratricopeptide (TPR) repeat protein